MNLIPEIEKIVEQVKSDCEVVENLAKERDVYVRIDRTQVENRRVEKWLSETFNIFRPEVNMLNFYCAKNSSSSYCWTLEYFKERMLQNLQLYFNISIDKNNKVTIKNYNDYHTVGIYYWLFNTRLEFDRLTSFKTTNKVTFIATPEEIPVLQKFINDYLKKE